MTSNMKFSGRGNGRQWLIRNGRTMNNLRHVKKLFTILLLAVLTSPIQTGSHEPIGSAKILSVVDGNTLKIKYQGKIEILRLIGIDAPVSRLNKKGSQAERSEEDLNNITRMSKEATRYVSALVGPGEPVKIEFDVEERDKSGRLLGYVYLSNGKMLNEEIVQAGYANLMAVPPNVKYQRRFLKVYQNAREMRKGLWR